MTSAPIVHNPSARRFEIIVDGLLSKAEYRLEGDTIIFTHTEVPEVLRGRGIASQLIKSAMAFARAENKQIVSECSYVTAWLASHP